MEDKILDEILKLKKEFVRIKNIGLIKSLRKGPTGVGYTFETMLHKKEDQATKPDFGSIELKCKLGYSKSDLTLFNCAPTKEGKVATLYLFEKYNYLRYGQEKDYILFERKVFNKYYITINKHYFKTFIDYEAKRIYIQSYSNNKFIENVCWWDFSKLSDYLTIKLSNLAIITAYPYRKNNETYYKYFNIKFYKLTSFYKFLELIEKDKIYFSFYIRKINGNIVTNKVIVRIKNKYIEELFYII